MAKRVKKFRSRGEKIFRFLFLLFVLCLLGLIFFKISSFVIDRNIDEQKDNISQKEQELSTYQSAVSYDKFLLAKNLENNFVQMPWFEHIPKILEIFEDLQNVDSSNSSIIVLSDFNVSLEEITLKGTVSSLKALYYNSPNGKFQALLDRFESLDFIEDMTIRTYEKVGGKYFEFVLNAKVVNNDGK